MADTLPLTWFAPKGRMIMLGLLGIGMTTLSVFVIFIGGPVGWVIGPIGTIFFGACTVAIFSRVFTVKPVLTVTERGIDLWRYPFIPWEELAAIEVAPSSGEVFLVFDVMDPEAYFARMSPLTRRWVKMSAALLPGAAYLSARALPEPVEDVAAKIGAMHPQNRG